MADNTKNINEEDTDIVDQVDPDTSDENKDNEVNDDSDLSDNEDQTLDNMLPNLSLKCGTERYVVTADGVPQFYTQNVEEANKRMWDVARAFKVNVNDYNCYIRECEDSNNIQVIGYYKFFVVSYDRVLCHFTTQKVHEVQEEQKEEEKEATDNYSYWTSFMGKNS
jgi:hypothetical protein